MTAILIQILMQVLFILLHCHGYAIVEGDSAKMLNAEPNLNLFLAFVTILLFKVDRLHLNSQLLLYQEMKFD